MMKSEFLDKNLIKIFGFEDNTPSIKNCRIESTDIIQKGRILTNDTIAKKFDLGNIGGIRYSKKNNIIALFATDSKVDNSEFITYVEKEQAIKK